MSFTDTLKKSLGFEETEDNKDKQEIQTIINSTDRNLKSNMDKLLDLLLLLVQNLKRGQLRCMMSMRSLFQTNPIMRLS